MSSAIEGLHILLAEDDTDLREIIKQELEYRGAQVSEAVNGQQAFTLLNNNHKIDLILSDIKMPIEDGLSLTKKVRALNSQTPAIFLMTGYSDFPASEAYNLGVEGFINKPFELDTVISDFGRILKPVSERWQQDFAAHSKIQIQQSLMDAQASAAVTFGRGGLLILLDSGHVRYGDKLELTFADGCVISGVVRWSYRSNEHQKLEVGLEFFKLNAQAFDFYNNFVKQNSPVAYIPQDGARRGT